MLLSCASDFTIKLMDITKEIIIISYSLTSIVRYDICTIHIYNTYIQLHEFVCFTVHAYIQACMVTHVQPANFILYVQVHKKF